jgi:hypothetical protein
MGAGGYRVNLIDASNPDEPIINDSIVDGCSVTGKREEDVNYKLTILTLGNSKKGNSDATTAVSKEFSTFTPTFKTIPTGTTLTVLHMRLHKAEKACKRIVQTLHLCIFWNRMQTQNCPIH